MVCAFLLFALLSGCSDEGILAVGELEVSVEVEAPAGTVTAAGAQVAVTGGWLNIEAIEVLGALGGEELEEGHSHAEGSEPGEEESEGEILSVVTPGGVIDLLQTKDNELHVAENARAGEYTNVFISVAPATTGTAAGSTLKLMGTATTAGESRQFFIDWRDEVDDFKALEVDVDLPNGGEAHARATVETAHIFEGVDFFAPGVVTEFTDGVTRIVVNGTTNTELLTVLREGLAAGMGVAGGEEDHEEHN